MARPNSWECWRFRLVTLLITFDWFLRFAVWGLVQLSKFLSNPQAGMVLIYLVPPILLQTSLRTCCQADLHHAGHCRKKTMGLAAPPSTLTKSWQLVITCQKPLIREIQSWKLSIDHFMFWFKKLCGFDIYLCGQSPGVFRVLIDLDVCPWAPPSNTWLWRGQFPGSLNNSS